ncbi:DUF6286 domain-containing protein [Nocardioides sp. NPDC057772]|uniref:DUF6286 domain-containing protein n=1 Tax=Nocardioides sp. NPDC057772 TaxID=3346245 RepID=UPI00366A62A6
MSTQTIEPTGERVVRPAAPRTQPRKVPVVVLTAVVLALVLIAIAVVAVRELLVSQGWAAGSPVVPTLVDALDGVRASVGLAAAGGGIALVGLVVLWLALRPGRRTHLRVAGDADLWLAPGAVAAVAQETADRLPGVMSADSSRSTRRRVVVDLVVAARATPDGPQEAAAVTEHVRAVLDDEVGWLTGTRIKVRATEVPR